jgi:arylsulfatase
MTDAPQPPNVLLVSVDHWPGSLLGIVGSAIQTPTIDQLARNGVRYPRAYSECPVCIPARRTLMTGMTPRSHGDRDFAERLPMPAAPTLAESFGQAGYQTYAVGKLHVYPPRDRIGFDDVLLAEEGRLQFGAIDDYELFLGDRGYAGQQFWHGMSNNEYTYRPWHLPEELHITNWTTQQAARVIKRRDPTRPGFWFVSYTHPHPPLVPLAAYLDLYRDVEPDAAWTGDWATDAASLPPPLQSQRFLREGISEQQARAARIAFYALCTHIDHQLRVVIGTLREEGLLNNTIILFTSDHGDMLGSHGCWAKRTFYEQSAQIPMILMGVAGDQRVGVRRTDERLVGWQDVMPTLLDLCDIEIPGTVDGRSMLGPERRTVLYGEVGEGLDATRMVHDGRFKLIYYPAGDHIQLFDLETDPRELANLAARPEHAAVRERLTAHLVSHLYGGDENWVRDGELVGLPAPVIEPAPNRGLYSQRGTHWPPSPVDDTINSIIP